MTTSDSRPRLRGARSRRTALIAAIAVAAGLDGCGGAPPDAAGAPSGAPHAQIANATRASIADAPTQAFLAAAYGPAASLRGEWRNQHGDLLRVCADGGVAVDAAPQRLIAVCATPAEADVEREGRIDLFALSTQDDRAVAVAEARALPAWFDAGPARVEMVRIGRVRHAFDIRTRIADDNGTLQQRTWYVARDGTFAKALSLPAHYSADGTAWCRYAETTTCTGSATDLAYDLRIDARDADAERYPLAVDTHGIRCDRPVAATATALAFDAATLAYRAPPALHIPTRDCEPDGAQPRSPHQD